MIVQEVIFHKKGTTEDAVFMDILKELTDEYISKQTGFINRLYFKHDDGRWVMYVFFDSNLNADQSFINYQNWEKSERLWDNLEVNGIIIHKYDLPVDLQKTERHYNSMIAQEIFVPLKEETTDKEMIDIFKMLTEEYFAKYPGYINRFFMKYDENHFLLYVFFDNNEHAVGCIADFRSWEKSRILIDAIYEDKLIFKHYEVNNTFI